MIASVVAHLNLRESTLDEVLHSISQNSRVEFSQLIDSRLLPMTLEADSGEELDEIHRRLCTLKAVDFIDVVYVHLEDANPIPVSTTSTSTAITERP